MNSSAAKKKVKSHVNRYKNESNFVLTERHILYWFGILNKAAFRNKLPVPTFKIQKMRGTWGWCIAKDNESNDVTIRINSNISNRELFISTLAHEMVHQHQYIFEGKMNHIGSFTEWKRFFLKNLHISI